MTKRRKLLLLFLTLVLALGYIYIESVRRSEVDQKEHFHGLQKQQQQQEQEGEEEEEPQQQQQQQQLIQEDEKNIPLVIVAGTQKGGTESFQTHLNNHPQIVPSSKKECHFFDKTHNSYRKLNQTEVRDAYFRRCFRNERSEIIAKRQKAKGEIAETQKEDIKFYLEKTPVYIFNPYIARSIERIFPKAKIIFLLRDPVERAYSGYKMNYEKCLHNKNCKKYVLPDGDHSFESCIGIDVQNLMEAGILDNDFLELDDEEIESRWLHYWEKWTIIRKNPPVCNDGFIGRGLYFMQLQRWIKFKSDKKFAKENNMLIIESKNMLPNTKTNIINFNPITDFIGIESFDVVSTQKIHATKDLGAMKEDTRMYLMNLFDPFNKKLVSILGDEWEDPWPYDIMNRTLTLNEVGTYLLTNQS